jgi:opacity protein-like surface antigen
MTRALLISAVLAVAATAAAQDSDPAPRAHRLTVSGGLTWLGGYAIGDNTATLRRNEPATLMPASFTLFDANASLARAAGFEARIGYALTRALGVEFGAAYAHPRLDVDITADQESSPVTLSDARVSQYTIDASVVWQLSRLRLGSHARPYVTAGGGYLRQLFDDRVKLETGSIINAGGGVRYWLRGGDAAHRAVGLRSEVLFRVRNGGIDIAGETRTFPVLNIFGFVGF